MKNDERCCGTGTCIIDAHGCCWCGQQWDGEKMFHPAVDAPNPSLPEPELTQPTEGPDTQ